MIPLTKSVVLYLVILCQHLYSGLGPKGRSQATTMAPVLVLVLVLAPAPAPVLALALAPVLAPALAPAQATQMTQDLAVDPTVAEVLRLLRVLFPSLAEGLAV